MASSLVRLIREGPPGAQTLLSGIRSTNSVLLTWIGILQDPVLLADQDDLLALSCFAANRGP